MFPAQSWSSIRVAAIQGAMAVALFCKSTAALRNGGAIHWRNFSVGIQHLGGEISTASSSSSSSIPLDDFRSLIARKKSEVAILEAALEILETAPRDKRFEDPVRKHNLQLESEKSAALGDVVVPNAAVVPNVTVETTTDRSWNVAKPSPSLKSESPLMFGKLSLDDFPPPVDPNLERLQKKRRRQELLREYERNNKRDALNFGAAGKSGSNPSEEAPVDPLRPNANIFQEKPGEKVYKSLADRLYEEQFGRPAPPGLKRTYPKGSFYDRCMKEKERKEREAAAAARREARSGNPSSPSPRDEETSETSTVKNNGSSNEERKPAAWTCPECTFFNLGSEKYCHKCQAERGERRSAAGG